MPGLTIASGLLFFCWPFLYPTQPERKVNEFMQALEIWRENVKTNWSSAIRNDRFFWIDSCSTVYE